VALEIENPLREGLQRWKVIGCKSLALEHGEVDLDLIEPARVDGTVDEYEVGKTSAESSRGGGATVCGAVVDDPEDPSRLAVGALAHGLGDQAIEAGDAVLSFAAAEEAESVDIESGEVSPGAKSPVLVLDSHGPPGLGLERRVLPGAGLDAGLLVGADHELVRAQPAALPDSVVEIEDPPGLLLEIRVAREDPTPVLPGSDGVFVEPSPDGGVADSGHQAGTAHMRAEFGQTPAREREPQLCRQLAGDGLNANDELWGGRPGGVRAVGGHRDPGGAARRSVSATC